MNVTTEKVVTEKGGDVADGIVTVTGDSYDQIQIEVVNRDVGREWSRNVRWQERDTFCWRVSIVCRKAF